MPIGISSLLLFTPELTDSREEWNKKTQNYLALLKSDRTFRDDPVDPALIRPEINDLGYYQSLKDQRGRDLLGWLPVIPVDDYYAKGEFDTNRFQILFDKRWLQDRYGINWLFHEFAHGMDPFLMFVTKQIDSKVAMCKDESIPPTDRLKLYLESRRLVLVRENRAWHYTGYLTRNFGVDDEKYAQHCYNTALYKAIDRITWVLMTYRTEISEEKMAKTNFSLPLSLDIGETYFDTSTFNRWAIKTYRINERFEKEQARAKQYHPEVELMKPEYNTI